MSAIEIAKKIYENGKCPECGGTLEKGECSYCGKVNEDVVKLINELENILRNTEFSFKSDEKITPVYNYFYLLRFMKIDEVDKIMNYSAYRKLLKDAVLDMDNRKLYLEDIELMKYITFYEPLDKKTNDKYLSFLLKSYIENKITMDRDEVEKLVVAFTKFFIGYATDYANAFCKIVKEMPDSCGGCFANYVSISSDIIDGFEKGNYLELFRTIFHECTHVRRFERFHKTNISYYDLMCIKDQVLSANDKKYYTDNYKYLFYEVEAFINEVSETLEYLECLKLDVSDDKLLDMKTFRQYVYNECFNKTERVVNGKSMDLTDAFDECIKDKPFLLYNYPALNFEYMIDNGSVRRKTIDEIKSSISDRDYIYNEEDLNYYLEYLNEINNRKK